VPAVFSLPAGQSVILVDGEGEHLPPVAGVEAMFETKLRD
jgi:deoxyinosine 3'endonuclease (endonuclease V)